ncbi:NapH/MauN family ferredoxin-type protein [Rhodoblastus sp.]|uniref:NapH/MauN family ferredoxin-type protein n=1 Tax=Rhodoblastus sp. TaxID=1962975 RepID=UPI003F9DC569
MGRLLDGLSVMLGRAPRKPTALTPAAQAEFARQNSKEGKADRKRRIAEEREQNYHSHFWRNWRWISIVVINLLFVLSYRADVQLVEGALTASRFVGFHMADVNSALQVMLAYKHVVINLVIGTSTVVFIWWLVGGRSFCAWACPYHLLAEWAEMLHLWLAGRGLVKDHQFHRGVRTVLYVVFAALAFVSGYTVFEVISPVGILSRAFTYGASLALIWVGVLLLIEIVYSRRFWCRYICPIGMTYGFVGATAPVTVTYDLANCLHEGKCRDVCMVPHVLEMTKIGYADDVRINIGADCTRCGMCLEVCPTKALTFDIKGLNKLL